MEIKATLQKPYNEDERLNFIVEYNHNLGYEINETETELQALGYSEEELNTQEKERVQELFMTRSDFFDGTIQAWGMGQDELLVLIQTLLATLPVENVKKLMAINNFKNALNFYRKHDLFKMLVNIPIPLNETLQIIITEEHLDKFFDEVDKGNKETAWQELPTPELIPIPEPEEPTVEVVEE
jgi:hypothetical protein